VRYLIVHDINGESMIDILKSNLGYRENLLRGNRFFCNEDISIRIRSTTANKRNIHI